MARHKPMPEAEFKKLLDEMKRAEAERRAQQQLRMAEERARKLLESREKPEPVLEFCI